MKASGSDLHECNRDFPNKLWQGLSPDVKQEAMHQFKLVHLFKQINPELHVCPRPLTTSRVLEKGVQVPDRRLPDGSNKKPRYKSGGSIGSRHRRRDNTKFIGAPIRHSSLAKESALRPDAPPHIPESIRKRELSSTSVTTSTNPQEHPRESHNDGSYDDDQEQTLDGVEDQQDSDVETRNLENKFLVFESNEEDSLPKNLKEKEEELKLERRWGYFFCRSCLHSWISGSVWCLKGMDKVYIQQTCNFCNVIVEPQVGGKFRENLFHEKWTAAVDLDQSDALCRA